MNATDLIALLHENIWHWMNSDFESNSGRLAKEYNDLVSGMVLVSDSL